MSVIWLHTLAIFALAVLALALLARLKMLETMIDTTQRNQGNDLTKIERLEKKLGKLQLKADEAALGQPVTEDEWMPPVVKHTQISG